MLRGFVWSHPSRDGKEVLSPTTPKLVLSIIQ